MAKLTKKQQQFATAVDREKLYGVDEAISIAKTNASAKFDETIEVALNLGVDPRHADRLVDAVQLLAVDRLRLLLLGQLCHLISPPRPEGPSRGPIPR